MRRFHKMLAFVAAPVIVAAAIVLSVTLLGGHGATATPETALAAAPLAAGTSASVADPSAALQEVVMSADFAVGYSSVGQLKKAAALVVRGEVTDVSYVDFNTCAYTRVTFKVSKCFKGDVAVGDEITIMEVGGITTMASVKGDKFGATTREEANTKVKVLLDGAPLTQVGEECLYFLGTGDIGVVSGTYYVPMGAFQGRFEIDNGVAKRFVPADMQGTKFTALAMDEPTVDATLSQAAVE